MLRNRPSNVLQKTYDDSYLSCSTAIYYESQGDELEAMRHWRNALEHIHESRVTISASRRGSQTDTEKALVGAIKELELQCKERIDLLEALRVSRQEVQVTTSGEKRSPRPTLNDSTSSIKGSIGQGTIPAAAWPDLSRPPLPHRPSLPARMSSENAVVGGGSGGGVVATESPSSASSPHQWSDSRLPSKDDQAVRSSSPEKHTMRTTLRSAEGPSKAATLAWSSLGPRDRLRKAHSSDSGPSASTSCPPSSALNSSSNQELASSARLPSRVINNPSSRSAPEAEKPSKPPPYAHTNGSKATDEPTETRQEKSGDATPDRESANRAQSDGLPKIRQVSDDPDSASSAELTKEEDLSHSTGKTRNASIIKNLPPGIDEVAAKQILNDIVVQGDEVHWGDVAGLEIAKNALREAVVYPFLRPDLFMGLREPARGMLLFGPPGTGKTMLARAVATESKSTFFSISASSLTSKYLGESEKLVKALFGLARALAPSIIFVDEIDSLLSQRSGSGEHEATRRIKTEFLIQWSDLQRAAAGVLVLAATNLPWAIDEAARRRFVRRQYIPLPEPRTRETQLRTLLGQQKHSLASNDIQKLVNLTEGFSGSDITALAKDAAMGPLRSLGEALLHMTMDEIRPIMLQDFEASLGTIRPSVSKAGLKEYEDWAKEFGERGG
ncbi:ATPase family associated with various cellular activities (AAA) domain-containing protein [Hirsutella rhossiliensis]|uniref:ATPase family associated with various cellular activities (AAA) domain-containing protein n=1 Tax=Hirsutella rhossiliensis TaxID=111463 RepID=A0A9P8MPS5_9HYPO|nr:ATPase family associated with various cellular activities (AAA) domain-containing protein [Hirsutella rhossiliensis]KAH0957956.1 ATPase family associated with various cellular activities (AAA) domain-containing protein [Hirsutella rhossiliensis]